MQPSIDEKLAHPCERRRRRNRRRRRRRRRRRKVSVLLLTGKNLSPSSPPTFKRPAEGSLINCFFPILRGEEEEEFRLFFRDATKCLSLSLPPSLQAFLEFSRVLFIFLLLMFSLFLFHLTDQPKMATLPPSDSRK